MNGWTSSTTVENATTAAWSSLPSWSIKARPASLACSKGSPPMLPLTSNARTTAIPSPGSLIVLRDEVGNASPARVAEKSSGDRPGKGCPSWPKTVSVTSTTGHSSAAADVICSGSV